MYRIYADDNILHDPNLLQEGCGVISPKLTLELNKAGSLSFTMPPNHMLYNKINKLNTTVTVYDDNDEIFRGRVLNDEIDFYNQKKMYVEGELAYLLDSIVRPYSFEGTPTELLTMLIDNHNARVNCVGYSGPYKNYFKIGNVNVNTIPSKRLYESKNYPNTLNEIEEKLINGVGGYIKIRRANGVYIDLTKESGDDSSQIIEFGVNLLDFSKHISAENLFTAIIPTGCTLSDDSVLTLENPYGTLPIPSGFVHQRGCLIHSAASNMFGIIEHYENWSDIKNTYDLVEASVDVLKRNINTALTIELKAVDLHSVDVNVERIKLGSMVTVKSIPHGFSDKIPCSKIVYDLTSPDQTEYTFGVKPKSLTEKKK